MNEQVDKPRILVVENNPTNIQLLGGILSGKGYKVSIAQSGVQALKSVKGVLPNLILLDVMMPEMDGFETCQCLKKDPRTKDIPIIFLTAKTEMDDIIKGFELGAVDYVTKPFNLHELLARISTHLKLRQSQDIILKQQEELINHQNELQEMIHVLCHDLANPLQAVMLNLHNLQDIPEIPTPILEALLSTTQQGVKLLGLIREHSAISEGKKQLHISPVNLKQAFENSLTMLEHRFSEKKILPVLHVPEKINILAEPSSLVNSVLNNLLTNAIKFSYSDSTILIEAQYKKDDEITITIQDSGIGMSQNLLGKIFRLNKETTRFGTHDEKGTGFGMPLVKKFVTAYGGEIEVSSIEESESADKHGTKVQLTLKRSS